jgi:hypothetical protein
MNEKYLFIAFGIILIGVSTFIGYEIGKSQVSNSDLNSADNSRSVWGTIGSVLGAAVGIGIVALLYWFWFRHRMVASSSGSIFTSSDLETMKTYGARPEHVTRRNL